MKTFTIFHRLILCMAGILLALLPVHCEVKAQCPMSTNVLPPALSTYICGGLAHTASTWAGPHSIVLYIDNCPVTITWCDRELDCWPAYGQNTIQSVIESISRPDSCSTINDKDIFDSIVNNSQFFNPTGPGIPPCGANYTPVKKQLYLPSCWELAQTDPRAFTPCGGSPPVFCVMSCDICADTVGHILKLDCVFATDGTPNCDPVPDNGWDSVGQCFAPLCGSRPK